MTQLEPRLPPARPFWLPVAIGALGGVWLYGASLLPQTAVHAGVGPGLYPTLVGLGLIGLALVLTVQIVRGERFEPQDAEDAAADQAASRPALLTAVLAAAVPLYTMERFGFILTAMLMFALTTRAFGSRRPLFDLALGGILGAAAWYGFSQLGVGLGPALIVPSLQELLPW